jgi:hypothetical protein
MSGIIIEISNPVASIEACNTTANISVSVEKDSTIVGIGGAKGDKGDPAITYIRRHAYINGVSYCGYAALGSTDIDTVWKITRITVAPNGTVTERAVANMVNWVDYLTHTYTIL